MHLNYLINELIIEQSQNAKMNKHEEYFQK